MKRLVLVAVLLVLPSLGAAQPVIQNTSIVRLRANNFVGVNKDVIRTPSFDLTAADSVTDEEFNTTNTATTSATYDIRLTATGARIGLQTTDQSYSIGSQENLTEGFIQFTTTEPYIYEVTGAFTGGSGDAGDGYQLRTLLRHFGPTFNTVYLEDETGFAASVSLAINGVRDSGAGAVYNQNGARVGILAAGSYEFAYELESSDDLDHLTASTASGFVRLDLRRLVPPTSLVAQASGNTVGLSWVPNADATSYQVEAGSTSGAANLFNGDVGNVAALATAAPTGIYYVRVRAKRAGLVSAPSNEVAFGLGNGGCIAPPAPPAGHAAQTANLAVALTWGVSPGASSYVLEAGTGAGLANLFNANVGGVLSLSTPAPAGTYFTRVRAVNGCGTSGASNQVQFTVACNAPAAPANLSFTKAGGLLTITWGGSPGALAYRLQAGTSSGASNVVDTGVGTNTGLQFNVAGVPAGTYFVRVLASGICGTSAASNEIAVPLP